MIVQRWFGGSEAGDESFMSGVCTDNNQTKLQTVFNSSNPLSNQVYVVTAGSDAVCTSTLSTAIAVNVARYGRPAETTHGECPVITPGTVTARAVSVPAALAPCTPFVSCNTYAFFCVDLEGCGYIPEAGIAIPANGTM